MDFKKNKDKRSLLDDFLGEYCIIFLTGMDTTIIQDQNEETELNIPLACEGIIVDYDEEFLLISDEAKTSYSLLRRSNIGKVDTVDKQLLVSDLPPGEMN